VTDPTALPNFSPPPAEAPEHALRSRVLGTLAELGLNPGVDDDGDVVVQVEEHRLYVRCTDSHPPLARVFRQWQIDADVPGDHLTRLEAANAVTGAIHLVKVTLVEDRLVTAVDLIVAESLDLASLLSAGLGIVVQSVQTWHATVTELAGGRS